MDHVYVFQRICSTFFENPKIMFSKFYNRRHTGPGYTKSALLLWHGFWFNIVFFHGFAARSKQLHLVIAEAIYENKKNI
jgi:hypothetical protein